MQRRSPLSPSELNIIADVICSDENQKKYVVGYLMILMNDVCELKKHDSLVVQPDLNKQRYIKQLVSGEYWKDQVRQRRRIKRILPIRERGAPKNQYADYLMIKLGEIYVRTTGTKPTLGGAEINLSKFERFTSPIMSAVGIGNFRNRVRQYIKFRKTQKL
jgi:hypothetical protein